MEETRRLGQVYTPVPIVDYILKQTMGPKLAQKALPALRLFEPSCGSGNFLIAAYDMLEQAYREQGVDPAVIPALILGQNLYGMDIDPRAVAVCKSLLKKRAGMDPPHIAAADALFPYERDARQSGVGQWLGELFDVVVGNPPYVSWQLTAAQRKFLRANYASARGGKINLYRAFIERCLSLLNNGGVLGFICPNTFLSDRDSLALRELLLAESEIMSIVPFAERAFVFKGIIQATTVIVLRKVSRPAADHYVQIYPLLTDVGQLAKLSPPYFIQQNRFHTLPGKVFLTTEPCAFDLIRKLTDTSLRLADVARIHQGEVNLTHAREDIYREPAAGRALLVRGRHVRPYYVDLAHDVSGRYCFPRKIQRRAHAAYQRIILQQISNMDQPRRLKGGVLVPAELVFAANSTNYLLPNHDMDIFFLLALVNSRVWNYLFRLFSSTNHITVRELAWLPVPPAPRILREQAAALAYQAAVCAREYYEGKATYDQLQAADARVNAAVYRLFNLRAGEIAQIERHSEKNKKPCDIFR